MANPLPNLACPLPNMACALPNMACALPNMACAPARIRLTSDTSLMALVVARRLVEPFTYLAIASRTRHCMNSKRSSVLLLLNAPRARCSARVSSSSLVAAKMPSQSITAAQSISRNQSQSITAAQGSEDGRHSDAGTHAMDCATADSRGAGALRGGSGALLHSGDDSSGILHSLSSCTYSECRMELPSPWPWTAPKAE
eukprot:241340-Prymnesium_polylepis.1